MCNTANVYVRILCITSTEIPTFLFNLSFAKKHNELQSHKVYIPEMIHFEWEPRSSLNIELYIFPAQLELELQWPTRTFLLSSVRLVTVRLRCYFTELLSIIYLQNSNATLRVAQAKRWKDCVRDFQD